MKKIFFIIMLGCISVNSSAASYSESGLITGMFSGEGNIVGIFHSAPKLNPAACSNGGGSNAYLIAYDSQADWNKVHSMLLSSYISQTPIKIAIHPTSCYANYPIIQRVAFERGY